MSLAGSETRPAPGGGRPKPKPRASRLATPRVRALFDYDAQDLDEISIREGDVFDLLKEG